MNENEKQLELIHRYLIGNATEEETLTLESMVMQDSSVRREFLRYAHLDAALAGNHQPLISSTIDTVVSDASQSMTTRSKEWLSWRTLAAVVTGLVFGICFTSLGFAYVSGRAAVQKHPLPVFDFGFEGIKPLDIGLPHNADEWGVRSARIVDSENGVAPLQGKQMLRMEPVLLDEQDSNRYAHAGQILDLRALPHDAINGNMEVEVAAFFCVPKSETKTRCVIRVVALNEPPATATKDFWSKSEDAGVVAMTQRFEIAVEDSVWHRFAMKVPLPQGVQSLVILLSTSSPNDENMRAPVSYLDDVRVSLLTSLGFQP
jgi:hypothetical protein